MSRLALDRFVARLAQVTVRWKNVVHPGDSGGQAHFSASTSTQVAADPLSKNEPEPGVGAVTRLAPFHRLRQKPGTNSTKTEKISRRPNIISQMNSPLLHQLKWP